MSTIDADHDLFQSGLFQPDTDDFTPLPERVRTLWRAAMLTSTGITAALVAAALGLLTPWLWDWHPAWAATAAVFAPLAAWRWHCQDLRWRFAGYRLDDEHVFHRYGLGERTMECFPYGRIQTVEISTTWWERRYRVATCRVSIGAGTYTHIGPVDPAEATRLRTALTEITRAKAVEL